MYVIVVVKQVHHLGSKSEDQNDQKMINAHSTNKGKVIQPFLGNLVGVTGVMTQKLCVPSVGSIPSSALKADPVDTQVHVCHPYTLLTQPSAKGSAVLPPEWRWLASSSVRRWQVAIFLSLFSLSLCKSYKGHKIPDLSRIICRKASMAPVLT